MSRGLVDKVVRLCETRGFVVESRVNGPQETSYSYNYGPLGTELRRNLRNAWWHDVVSTKGYVHGIETGISFPQEMLSLNINEDLSPLKRKESRNNEQLIDTPVSRDKNVRQTATSIQLVRSVPGLKLPFGIARNKKCVRSPENNKYLLRSCQGEVMNLQFFCAENRTCDWTNYWRRQRLVWWRKFANTPSNYTIRESQSDIEPGVNSYTLLEYGFTWGKEILDTVTVWSALCKDIGDDELCGLPFNKHSLPHVLEVNTDLDKGFLAILMDAFVEKERSDSSGNVAVRSVLHLHPHLAPVKVSVVPQEPSQSELCEVAQQLSSELREAGISTQSSCDGSSPDECYIYSDEIGTPYCVTILDSTLSNGVVTFRSRNTTLQEFLHISEILSTVKRHLGM